MASGGKVVVKIDGDTGGFKNAMGKVGGIAKSAAVGLGVGFASAAVAGTTAVAGLTTAAVKAYGDYEQLVGGIETLFGNGGKSLEEYASSTGKSVSQASAEYNKLTAVQEAMVAKAQGAYATAQMSANDYMQTATSFAASLVSSLGGDTEKAAQYADRAIVDMADNANKMGTNIQDIQNAYQGFAKQNYTMLDNLKLGYGGTQTEMQRLIADASKMTDVQKQLGITVDSSSMSFDNIVNAIHVMQTSMGIAGISIDEAKTTIQGSLGMVKASWENLLVALGDPEGNVEQAMQNLTTSVQIFGSNLLPVIQQVLANLPNMISTLGTQIVGALPGLTSTVLPALTESVNSLLNAIVAMLPQLVTAIVSVAPQLITGIETVFTSITAMLPTLLTSVTSALVSLAPQIVESVNNMFSTLVATLPGLINTLITTLIALAPTLISGITTMLSTLSTQLPAMIQPLLDNLPEIVNMLITSIITLLTEGLPTLISMLGTIAAALTQALPTVLGALIQAIPQILLGIFTALINSIGALFNNLKAQLIAWFNGIGSIFGIDDLGNKIAAGISSIIAKFAEMGNKIKNTFSQVKNNIVEAFTKAFENAKNALSNFGNSVSNVVNNIKQFFTNLWESIKNVFSSVGSFFSSIFSTAASGIQSAWSGISSFFSGIWSGITSVFSSVGGWFSSMFTQAAGGIKNAFNSIGSFFSSIWGKIKGAFNFSEMNQIGQNLVKGLANGINAATGWLMGLVKSFCGKIVGTVKNILGIHSPSKVFRDEVGKMIVLGIAEGIEDNRTEVEKVMDSFSEDLLDIEKKYEAESKRLEDDSTESSKKYLENLKETAEKERKLYDARQKDIQNLKQNILNTYKEMTTAAFDNIEDIEKLQESMADKLKDYGDLVETDITVFFNDKPLTKEVLGDLSAQTEKLKEYEKVLFDVKNRGKLPEGFFDIMRDMSVDEGLKFGKLLLNASDEEFNKYISDWQKKQETAERISKAFYRDESEAAADELVKTFSQTPKEFFDLGEDSIEAFGEGFMNNLTETMQKVAEKINITLGSLFPQVAYPEGSPLKSYADNRIINIYGSKKSTREVIEAYNQNEIYTKHTRGW